jgi:lipopolysaccharide transport system permease protein
MALPSRQPSSPAAEILTASAHDLIEALRLWRLWSNFGWHDLLFRYRRSWLGPVWIVLSASVLMASLSLVYGVLFQAKVRDYLPFVALGIAVWNFIAAICTEGVTTFVEAETYIRQMRVNIFVYVLRVVWRNVLIFCHQFIVALAVLVACGKLEIRFLPIAFVGLVLLMIQAIWVTTLLAIAGARFRDLQPIILNVLQVLFFVTPVIWMPAWLGSWRWVSDFNPIQSLIAVVREPLLGEFPRVFDYASSLGLTILGGALAMAVYGRLRHRVVYWL